MTIFEAGDLVDLPFPFIDTGTTKLRPALALSSAEFQRQTGACLLVMLTSAGRSQWPNDLLLYWAFCPEIPGANGQGETVDDGRECLRALAFQAALGGVLCGLVGSWFSSPRRAIGDRIFPLVDSEHEHHQHPIIDCVNQAIPLLAQFDLVTVGSFALEFGAGDPRFGQSLFEELPEHFLDRSVERAPLPSAAGTKFSEYGFAEFLRPSDGINIHLNSLVSFGEARSKKRRDSQIREILEHGLEESRFDEVKSRLVMIENRDRPIPGFTEDLGRILLEIGHAYG